MVLWPPQHSIGDDEQASDATSLDAAQDSACLRRQAIRFVPQSAGWTITIDSSVETGKVEIFIPKDRSEPARVVADTRDASKPLTFDQLFSAGNYAEAMVVAEEELKSARRSIASDQHDGKTSNSPESFNLVKALSQLAIISLRNGNVARAESALNDLIPICESAPIDHAATLIRSLHDRAYLKYLYQCTDEEAAVEIRCEMSAARKRAEQLVGLEHLEVARILTSQARILISDFSYSDAEELLAEALRIRTRQLGPNHRDVAESLLEMARLHAYRDDDDEADELFRQVIQIREAQCGPNHPDLADALFQYTDFFTYNRKTPVMAATTLKRALEIWSNSGGLDHPMIARESGFIRKVLTAEHASDTEAAH